MTLFSKLKRIFTRNKKIANPCVKDNSVPCKYDPDKGASSVDCCKIRDVWAEIMRDIDKSVAAMVAGRSYDDGNGGKIKATQQVIDQAKEAIETEWKEYDKRKEL